MQNPEWEVALKKANKKMKRRRRHLSEMEVLEDRALLSATAIYSQANGTLRIRSDSGSDQVSIEGTGEWGSMAVYINGAHAGDFTNVKGIKATMGAGDDVLTLGAVRMNGNLTASMGEGGDDLIVDNIPDLSGNPPGNVQIAGAVKVNMGGDTGDLVTWTSNFGTNGTTVIGPTFFNKAADVLIQGTGGTYAVENGDVNFQGGLRINLGESGDHNADGWNMRIDDLNVLKTTKVRGARSFDRILITDTRFTGDAQFLLRTGQNRFDLDDAEGPNRFGSGFKLIGKGFMETYDANPATDVFVGPVEIKGIENFV